MRPTINNAKKIAGKHGGWGGFKHSLMKALGIPANQYDNWDVPHNWKYAYLRAIGWSAKEATKQLTAERGNKEHGE